MTKKQVIEARRAFIERTKELMAMDNAQLQAEIRRAFPIVQEATEKEALQYMVLDAFDRAFPDPRMYV